MLWVAILRQLGPFGPLPPACKYLVVKSCTKAFVTDIFFWAFSFEQGSSHGVIRVQGYFF